MVEITKIERASKAKPLYHIYAQDTLLLTITEDTLLRFNLSKGKILTEETLEELYQFDQVQKCVHQALRYLSRRAHFSGELARKLKHKGFDSATINQAISYLQEKHYLDDEQLCLSFIHDGIKLKKYGPLLLRKKLLEKGVPEKIIEAHLLTAYPQNLQESTALTLAGKKMKSYQSAKKPEAQIRQKLAAFLQQRGFGWAVIRAVIAHLTTEQPEDEGD